MIRILAVSLSAVVLVAASYPAAAQQRSKGPGLRTSGPSTFAAKRFAAPRHVHAPRRFRSFNPPSPSSQPKGPARAFSRGLAPPSPTAKTAPHYIGPQAPTGSGPQGPAGGQNVVSRFDSVPPSLPVPMPSQSTPTAAPTEPNAPEVAAVGAPMPPAPQDELQAPIPETAVVTSALPAAAATKAPETVQIVRHVHEVRVVYVPAPQVRRAVKRKRVYVEEPVYVSRRVYRPQHVYAGPRIHVGIGFGRGFRRW